VKVTVVVIASLIAGYILGKMGVKVGELYELTLYLLIFIIGFDIGLHGRWADIKKSLSVKSLLLPIATLIGSLIGGVIGGIILNIPLKWAIPVVAGVGWYSLTGPILAQYSAFYGIIGFLANFLREVFTVILYPFFANMFGKEPSISIGGATTMDSTLPIITKFGGKEITMIAFIHGFILSLIVPVIVPFLASIAAGG